MRFRWDKKYLYWGVTAFCVIAASIVFFLILSKISAIKGFFGIILKVIKPVLYGLLFAYLMNPLVKTFERPILVQWGEKIYGKRQPQVEKLRPLYCDSCWRWCWCF